MRLYLFSLCFLLAFSSAAIAQNPVPAPKQPAPVLILGATAHLGNGTVIANSAIAFENGKITLVADATTIRLDRTKFGKIYDAAGKQVYPGFIAPTTTLGLGEVEAVRATRDMAEAGSINPNARALVAYNTDSDIVPTVRANGVLLAEIAPEGGLVSGTSSVVQLDAWNWEDAALKADNGIHLNWPAMRRWQGWETGNPEMKKNDQYDKDILALRRYFDESKAYLQDPNPAVKNIRFEAMRGLFNQSQTLFMHTGSVKTMQEAVLFAEQYKLRFALVGAEDAWLMADFLKEHKVSVILASTQSLPGRDDDDIDQPYKTAALLHEKGILFAFGHDGNWKHRNLPFQAGQAVGFGLPKEAAIAALTLNTAMILQIDAQCGSLEVGKDATLFISEGDALDMRTNQVTAAFIQGREINLDNKHKKLSKRFEEKYKQ